MKNIGKASLGAKEKKIKRDEKTHEKMSNKMLWVILVILFIGLISFVVANIDTFHLSMSSNVPSTTTSCETNETPLDNGGLASGVRSSDGRCIKQHQDEERWRDLKGGLNIVAVLSNVIALILVISSRRRNYSKH